MSSIKCKAVKYVWAPYYPSLSVSVLLEHAAMTEVVEYLPKERKEWDRLPRQFILNLCGTVLEVAFQQWVRERIEERNAKLANDNNLLVTLDEEVYSAFVNSNHISSKSKLFIVLSLAVQLVKIL